MNPPAVDSQYAQAVEDYDALRKTVPKLRSSHAWLRDADDLSDRIKAFVAPGIPMTKGVRRDYVVCALANKGCNTHASVRMLTDAGNGDDAMVLTRVLLETAVVFRWMMIDPVYRLDLYGLSSKLFVRHWDHLVQEHFSGEPDVVAKAKAALTTEESAVVQAAFGNAQYKWARERQPDGKFIEYSFDGMLKDIEKAEGTVAMKNFIYEVSYHMHSAHAHATADGMRQFKTLGQQQFFTCELGFNGGDSTLALKGANTYLSWLLSHVAAYLGLSDVEAEFDQWVTHIQARNDAAAPGAGHAGT
jgi:hypothetical protein